MLSWVLAVMIGFACAADAVAPDYVGTVEWTFTAKGRFEDFHPYTDGDSQVINPGRVGECYPPQLKDAIVPVLRAQGLVALAKQFAELGIDARDFVIFGYGVTCRSSAAARATHDGHGGQIKFKANGTAHYLGPRRLPKSEGYEPLGVRAAGGFGDGWDAVPPGTLTIERGVRFGRLLIATPYDARSGFKFEGFGRSHEFDPRAGPCEDVLLADELI